MSKHTVETSFVATRFTSSEPTGQAGVGIYFQQDQGDEVYVKQLVKGASAERDETVHLGDVITTIDGRNVVGQSLNTLRTLIRGEVGTYVDLGFRRMDHNSGQEQYYEVSLMRGSAEYLAWMERKEVEDQLAKLRRELRDAELELERVRRQMREAEMSADAVRQEVNRIRPQIESNKENLADVQERTRQELDECRRLEDLISPLEQEREGGKRELDRLRKSLRGAEDSLLAAKDALDEAQRRYAEMEEASKKQAQARMDCDSRLKKTEEELARRREDDRKFREEQERLRHQMELDVRALRNRVSQEQHESIRETQRREAAQERCKLAEEDKARAEADNSRLHKVLREGETLLQQSQLSKTQVEAAGTELQRAVTKLTDQAKVQETHIEDLKRRLLEERDRWEKSVAGVQAVRQEERARFSQREEQLTSEHNRVSDLFQQTRMSMEKETAKLNGILGRITPETASMQSELSEERTTTEQLRQEMNALAQRMERAGSDLLASRDVLTKVETDTNGVATDKDRSERRTQGIEEELRHELEKEGMRAQFVRELERKMEEERVELAKVIQREEDKRRETEVETLRLEEAVRPVAEKIRVYQSRDREWYGRMEEYRLVHSDLSARFTELVRQQANVRGHIRSTVSPFDDIHRPVRDYGAPYHNMPTIGAADPSQLRSSFAGAGRGSVGGLPALGYQPGFNNDDAYSQSGYGGGGIVSHAAPQSQDQYNAYAQQQQQQAFEQQQQQQAFEQQQQQQQAFEQQQQQQPAMPPAPAVPAQ